MASLTPSSFWFSGTLPSARRNVFWSERTTARRRLMGEAALAWARENYAEKTAARFSALYVEVTGR